jgi:hypothetical protein
VDFPCVPIPVEILLGDKIQKRNVYFVCYILLYGIQWITVVRELLTCFLSVLASVTKCGWLSSACSTGFGNVATCCLVSAVVGCWSRNRVIGIATNYGLDGPVFETMKGQ